MLVSLHSISTLPFTSFAFLVQEHSKAHIYREKKEKKCTDIVSFNLNDYSDGPELLRREIREGAKYTQKKLIKVIVQSSIHRPYYLIEIEFHHVQRYQENKIYRVETRCDRQKGTTC